MKNELLACSREKQQHHPCAAWLKQLPAGIYCKLFAMKDWATD